MKLSATIDAIKAAESALYRIRQSGRNGTASQQTLMRQTELGLHELRRVFESQQARAQARAAIADAIGRASKRARTTPLSQTGKRTTALSETGKRTTALSEEGGR